MIQSSRTNLRLTISFCCRVRKAQLHLNTSKLTAKQQIMTALFILLSAPLILSNTVISEPRPLKHPHADRLHKKSMAGWGKFYKRIRIMQGWPVWMENKHHIKMSSAFAAIPRLWRVPLNPHVDQENRLLRVLVGTAPQWKTGGK